MSPKKFVATPLTGSNHTWMWMPPTPPSKPSQPELHSLFGDTNPQPLLECALRGLIQTGFIDNVHHLFHQLTNLFGRPNSSLIFNYHESLKLAIKEGLSRDFKPTTFVAYGALAMEKDNRLHDHQLELSVGSCSRSPPYQSPSLALFPSLPSPYPNKNPHRWKSMELDAAPSPQVERTQARPN